MRARSLNAVDVFGGSWSLDEAAAAFAGLCDRAAEHGLLVHLEFLPWSRIPDLATAWEVVRAADRPNGGLMLDAWHYFRSKPDGALLRSIPGASILGVQLCDAPAVPEPEPLQATLHERLLPGDGDLDLRLTCWPISVRPARRRRSASRCSPTNSMPWTPERRAGWPAPRCAAARPGIGRAPATRGAQARATESRLTPPWSGDSTLHTTRFVPAAMFSVTGTVCHEVQADVLGTWSVAVPWTWPVSGSSARTVSVDGVPVALATRHRGGGSRPRHRDGHGHAAPRGVETGDVAHASWPPKVFSNRADPAQAPTSAWKWTGP